MESPRSSSGRVRSCFTCRNRKLKCDRELPCTRCIESGFPEECAYGTTSKPMERLQAHVNALQKKLASLENSTQHDTNRVRTQLKDTCAGPSSSRRTIPGSGTPNCSGPTGTDLPPELLKTVMDAFVHRARTFGFFLHPRPSFLRALLYSHTPSEIPISPLLRHSVHFLGLHQSLPRHESILFKKGLQPSCAAVQLQYAIQNIQAEVLLFYYFLRQGNFAEARIRLESAISFIVTYGFHKMGQQLHDELSGGANNTSIRFQSSLPPVMDALEYEERLCGFWTVVHLYKFWTSQSDLSKMLDEKTTTPFPTQMPIPEQGLPPLGVDVPRNFPLRTFRATPTIDPSDSLLTLTVKASVLFEHSISWNLKFGEDMQGFYNFKTSLSDFITAFVSQSKFQPQYSKEDFEVLKIHTMLQVAVINLWQNRFDEEAKASSLKAAQAAANGFRNTPNPYDEDHVDPMFGPLWFSVCDVLFSTINEMQPLLPQARGETMAHYCNITGLAGDVLRAMKVYSSRCGVINTKFQEIEGRWLKSEFVGATEMIGRIS